MSDDPPYATAEDNDLVSLAKDGDTAAYEELVSRHRDKIYARAFGMVRNEDDATDLSQEAWIRAWSRLHQFHGDSSFRTWLTRIIINLCLDFLRRKKRIQADSIDQMEEEQRGLERRLPVATIDPLERMERRELRRAIDEAMAQLSDTHRAVLILYQFENLEYKEIAERMSCSIGTVMSRLFYARRKLAALLDDLKHERKQSNDS